jgi:hypothetical protein
MIRKFVAGLAFVVTALVGMLVLSGAELAAAQDGTGPTPTQVGPRANAAAGCAWAGRLLGYLEKVQERGTALLAWLEAKQPELSQGNPEVAARIGTAITAIRTRLSELNEHVPALRARITERCPAGS